MELLGVTATAVRQRLTRLMEQGLVARQSEAAGRGRPMHRYSLTPAGVRSAGNNYDQLAQVLWDEMRAIEDPEVRQGLLKRISQRLADVYRDQIAGDTLRERMASLAELMSEQDLPFELDGSDELPVLTALACPYPDLAERDRGVCAMEKMLISEVLGERRAAEFVPARRGDVLHVRGERRAGGRLVQRGRLHVTLARLRRCEAQRSAIASDQTAERSKLCHDSHRSATRRIAKTAGTSRGSKGVSKKTSSPRRSSRPSTGPGSRASGR